MLKRNFSFFSLYLLRGGWFSLLDPILLCSSSFSLLNDVTFARCARDVKARARVRVWACCCSPICICCISSLRVKREKDLDVMCVWVRDLLLWEKSEKRKREKSSSHETNQQTKGRRKSNQSYLFREGDAAI